MICSFINRPFGRVRSAMVRYALVACLLTSVAGCGRGSSSTGTPPADDPPWQDIASTLEPLRAQYDLPAMTAAALAGDQLIALGAVGVRKLGEATAVEDDDLWHLGSCTKAMTASLLGTFVEEGLLAWDTTLAQGFSNLAGTMHPDYRAVTLEQLLAHWGGTWTTFTNHDAALNALVANQGTLPEQRATFTEQMLSEAPESPPGTVYGYSNAGYIVVGAAMERASGSSWEQLIRQRLFEPLGMSSCGFGPPGNAQTVEQPWGHAETTCGLQPVFVDNPPALGPAGTIHCSMQDWGRFLADQNAGDRGEPALLSAQSYQRLHTAWPGGSYALGWGVISRTWAGGTAYTHQGSNTLWLSVVWLAPSIDMAFLGAVNTAMAGSGPALDAAFSDLINVYAP